MAALPLSPESAATRTTLSESFEGAVSDAVGAVLRGVADGEALLRVDFDTSGGDETYTTFTNSLEFARNLAFRLGPEFERLCLYFPDAGAAAGTKNQWEERFGTVPETLRFAAFPRDAPLASDAAFFVVCPKASEAVACEALVDDVGRDQRKPVILLNPELVDMGSTGYGYAGRVLKKRLLDSFLQAYYLKTIPWGAVAKTHPSRVSVYQEIPGGYRLIDVRDALPNGDDLDDLFELVAQDDDGEDGDGGGGGGKKNALEDIASGFSKFARGFSKL